MQNRYLLDTNICISMLKNKYGIREHIIDVGVSSCYVSEITIAELYYGASKSGRKQDHIKDVGFIANNFEILPIYPVLELYGDVRAELERQGTPIDDFDILIGATSIVNHLTMVTDNVRHLGRLPDIVIENWKE